MSRRIDLTGQTFGRILITEEGAQRGDVRYWKGVCSCEDQTPVEVSRNNLRSGHTRSCGCLSRERTTTHGKNGSPVYSTWQHMKTRCYNPRDKHYASYGGRGISVCSRWLESFENFYEDMGDPPEGMTLDREANDGNYCKENCRWATKSQQQRNRRNTHLLIYRGETKCLADWAEEMGIHAETLRSRLNLGWSIEKAFTTPVRRKV